MKWRDQQTGKLYSTTVKPPPPGARLVGASRVLELCPEVPNGLPDEIAGHYRELQALRIGTGVPDAGPYAAEREGDKRIVVYNRTLRVRDRWTLTGAGWVRREVK